MNLDTKESLIRFAMLEAQKAVETGNYPFGAVIADHEGKVIATAHNTQEIDKDPTAHAEINLIRHLAKTFNQGEFSRFYLISNAESCSMCFSAAIKSGIIHYIFGAPSEPHMDPFLPVSEVAKFSHTKLDITLGVLEEECRQQISEARSKQHNIAQ
jgi:tRNA(adenine34) deaminase